MHGAGTATHCLKNGGAQDVLWRFHVLKSSGCEGFCFLGGALTCSTTAVCPRPQYLWGSNTIKAYWVFFKTEQERRRALDMTGRYLVSSSPLPASFPHKYHADLSTQHAQALKVLGILAFVPFPCRTSAAFRLIKALLPQHPVQQRYCASLRLRAQDPHHSVTSSECIWAQGPYPAMLLREEDPQELYKAMRKAPGASHSRGRVVLVENLSPSTSLSGLLRPLEGFHLQEHAATLLETVRVLSVTFADAPICIVAVLLPMNVCYYCKPVACKVLEQAALLAATLASMGAPAWSHHHAHHAKQLLRAACSLLQSAAKSDDGPLELRDKWTSNTEARLPTKAMQVHLEFFLLAHSASPCWSQTLSVSNRELRPLSLWHHDV